MKYYLNVVYNPNDDRGGGRRQLEPQNTTFRYPTAPMYQQDGVYNQLCRYRLVNYQMFNLDNAERIALQDCSIIVRFENIPCRNNFNLFNWNDGLVQEEDLLVNNRGSSCVEFHLRIPEGLVQELDANVPATGQLDITTISTDHSSVELVGAPCWGNDINVKLLRYRTAAAQTEVLEDVDFAFTLEVEPIFEKI